MKINIKKKEEGFNQKDLIGLSSWKAFFLSISLVVVFAVMQAMETRSDTNTDQVQLSVSVADTISINCGADVNLGSLTPGTEVTGSSTCTVTTNAAGGYELAVKRDDSDTTLDLTTDAAVNITDKTAWDPTASTGDGNAASYIGTGLAFSVYGSSASKNTTWWGTGTTCGDASNLFAGFPVDYANIMEHTSYSSSSTTTNICYTLDVPSTQQSGTYNGTITYQATSTP